MRERLPGWACFEWWWLLVFMLVDIGAAVALGWKNQRFVGFPVWVPDWWIVWGAVQAFIVVRRRGRGWSVYPYVVACALLMATHFRPIALHAHFVGVSSCLVFAGNLVLWSDFERAFADKNGQIEKLSGWMVVFFSCFYFQYKLHEMYERERTDSLAPAGMPN